MHSRENQIKAFSKLLDIMDEIREKCPWDKKQTMQSLRHLTIEETYELGDAILDKDFTEVKKELGDIDDRMPWRDTNVQVVLPFAGEGAKSVTCSMF